MTNLRAFTQARVGLGIAGDSLPTAPLLALRLAHARAKDAVNLAFDTGAMVRQIAERGWSSVTLESAAATRQEYLRRPDLGRLLSSRSTELLRATPRPHRLVFALSDGLSAPAAERHALPLMEKLFLLTSNRPAEDNPIILVSYGRVAIGDAIGEQLDADLLVLLIGERPGLSAHDSLGVYLTWRPRVGRIDAERNCVSNIHSEGLSYDKAAHKTAFLIRQMQRYELSGVRLKDTSSLEPPSLIGNL